MEIDPLYWRSLLILEFNGTNGAAGFVDSSPVVMRPTSPLTVTGTVLHSSTQAKFGATSVALTGTSTGNNISNPNSLVQSVITNSAFTVEFFVYITAYNASGGYIVTSGGGGTTYNSTNGPHWTVTTTASGIAATWWNGTASVSATAAASLNAWHHVVFQYNGTTHIQLFIDGRLYAGGLSPTTPSSPTQIFIGTLSGATAAATNAATCYVDSLRIVKGVAVYPTGSAASAFSVPTAAYPDSVGGGDASYASVSLLLHGDGADASTTYTDNAPSPHTVTVVGGAQIRTAQSKFGGSSMYFNGTDACLTLPNSTDFDFGASDFTVELWAYLTPTVTSSGLFATHVPASGTTGLLIYKNANGDVLLYMSTGGAAWDIANAVPFVTGVTFNTWVHLAVCRIGTVTRLYYNGVFVNAVASALTMRALGTDIPVIGRWASTLFFSGYIDDLRITKGVGRYTATDSFTPPATSYAVAPTVSLVAMNDPAALQVRAAHSSGNGTISGTVYYGSGTPVPSSRRVRLMRDIDGAQVTPDIWSDASTGAFSFVGVNTRYKYTTIAYDETNTFGAVIANNITPT